MLKSKKHNSQDEWVAAWKHAKTASETPEGRSKAAYLVERAIYRIPTESTVYGWSGGKDTLALQVVCEACGVTHGVLGTIGMRWEYPSFAEFVNKAKPKDVELRDFGYSAEWLNAHPRYVFPETAKDAYYWFQHCNQAAYYGLAKDIQADNIVLGHRKQDGNVCGSGEMVREKVRKVFPLYDWTHEDVFLVIACNGMELPQIYFTENGFYQGTHAWPMRTGKGHSALDEIWRIDRSILCQNADIDKVHEYLEEKGVA